MGNVGQIRNASAFPQKIRIEVNSYYDDTVPPLPWIPKSVTYHFKEGHNSVSEAITQDLIGVQMTIPDSGGMTVVFGKAKLEMEQASWSVEQADRRFQGATCLPPVQLRPYAFLDYIAFAKKGTYDRFQFDDRFLNYYLENVSRKAGFAKVDLDGAFRKTMLTANAAGHGTVLTSDAYGDRDSLFQTKGGLVVQENIAGLVNGGGTNAPEIDHIFPENQGGANCFSNARLTSKSYNAAKRDSVQQFELMPEQLKAQRYQAWVAYIQTNFPTSTPSWSARGIFERQVVRFALRPA